MRQGDYHTTAQAERYHKTRFTGGLSLVHKDEVELLGLWLKKAHTSQPQVYLDLGAGTGRIVKTLLKHHPKTIYALDSSRAMLSYLIKKDVIKPVVATSDKIPLPEKSIDIATAFHLFKHLPNIRPTLREVYRVLKEDGYLVFDILNKNSLVRFNTGTCYVLSEKELRGMLTKAGFKIEKIVYLHYLGETVYNLLGLPLAHLVHLPDKVLGKTGLKLGTKILVLAQKQ